MSGAGSVGGVGGASETRAGTAERWISAQAVPSHSQTNSPRHSNASESPRAVAGAAGGTWSGANVPSGPSPSSNFRAGMLESGPVPSLSGPFASSGPHPTQQPTGPSTSSGFNSPYGRLSSLYSYHSSPATLGHQGASQGSEYSDMSMVFSAHPTNRNSGGESSSRAHGSFHTPLKALNLFPREQQREQHPGKEMSSHFSGSPGNLFPASGNEKLYEAYNDLHGLAQDFHMPLMPRPSSLLGIRRMGRVPWWRASWVFNSIMSVEAPRLGGPSLCI